MATNNLRKGARVMLTRLTPELATEGLKIGQIGKVAVTSSGSKGVIFKGDSDTGWNSGLNVTRIGTHDEAGQYVRVIDLCGQVIE